MSKVDYEPWPIGFSICRCSGCDKPIYDPSHYIFPVLQPTQQIICVSCKRIIYNYARSLKYTGYIVKFIQEQMGDSTNVDTSVTTATTTKNKQMSELIAKALQNGATNADPNLEIFGKQQNS